jgi:predicted ATPase/DNA-binding CsgD family transcriptional regulator
LAAERRDSLPAPVTPLIGRERERAVVLQRLFHSDGRLLTLTGAPGIGKSRLALAAVTEAEVAECQTDRVCWIDLVPVVEEAAIPADCGSGSVGGAIAAALGLREEPGQPPLSTVASALRDRETLLVLDNCEHVAGACAAAVRALLPACPRLRVLATSRTALGIAEEEIWRVPPLSLPEPQQPLDLAAVAAYDAIQLFVARTQAVAPAFALAQHNLAAVVDVCRRLDGVPLALELVAPRLRVLGVDEVAARLGDALRVLAANDDARPEHQATMRATLDWSHRLLGEAERALFRRLAVFAGGWTTEAAEAVCVGGGVAREHVLDLLCRLETHSLIVPAAPQDGVVRCRMLEVVRQYAADHLKESGEEDATRQAHAAYHLNMARSAGAMLRGPAPLHAAQRLTAEHANLRGALAWSMTAAAPWWRARGVELAISLWWFWFTRGHLAEGRASLHAALTAAGDIPPDLRATVLYRAGHLAWVQGDYDQASVLCEEAASLCDAAGDRFGCAVARGVLAYVAYAHGDPNRAFDLGREVMATMQDLRDPWGVAMTSIGLGLAALHRVDYDHARALFEAGLDLHRKIGDRRGEAEALNNLGIVLRKQRRRTEAAAQHHASVQLFRDLGDTWQLAGALLDLGTVDVDDGALDRAAACFRESLALYHRLGDRRGTATALQHLADVAAARDDATRAARLFGAAAALCRRVDLPPDPPFPDDRRARERSIGKCRTALGDAVFRRVWMLGESAAPDLIVADALRVDVLTFRELEIVRLVARGLDNERIAALLGITLGTTKRHVSNILDKLDLKSRGEVTQWALEHGLLHDPTA